MFMNHTLDNYRCKPLTFKKYCRAEVMNENGGISFENQLYTQSVEKYRCPLIIQMLPLK